MRTWDSGGLPEARLVRGASEWRRFGEAMISGASFTFSPRRLQVRWRIVRRPRPVTKSTKVMPPKPLWGDDQG